MIFITIFMRQVDCERARDENYYYPSFNILEAFFLRFWIIYNMSNSNFNLDKFFWRNINFKAILKRRDKILIFVKLDI